MVRGGNLSLLLCKDSHVDATESDEPHICGTEHIQKYYAKYLPVLVVLHRLPRHAPERLARPTLKHCLPCLKLAANRAKLLAFGKSSWRRPSSGNERIGEVRRLKFSDPLKGWGPSSTPPESTLTLDMLCLHDHRTIHAPCGHAYKPVILTRGSRRPSCIAPPCANQNTCEEKADCVVISMTSKPMQMCLQ